MSERRTRVAVAALVGTTLFWGSTFFLMKLGTAALAAGMPEETRSWAPLLFLAVRFAVAALAFPLVFPSLFRRKAWTALRWGVAAGIPFTGGFILQIYGLQGVEPSVSALLTSMFVVFTPLLVFAISRQPPARPILLGIGFAVAGLVLVTGARGAAFGTGEILSLLCALVFAGHILVTDVGSKRVDPIAMAWHSVTFAAIACALPLLAVRPSPFASVPGALKEAEVWVSLGVTSILATIVSIALMTYYQRFVSPNRAAVIYTTEPVFAALFSWIFFGELFGESKLMGGLLIIAGNIACGLKPDQPVKE